MNYLTNEFIEILKFLLPGFITAWVFYGLTAYAKPSQFERVVQALIFTIIVQAIVIVIHWSAELIGEYYFIIGRWNNNLNLIYSIVIAFIIGLLFSYFANNDKIHSFLRKKRITKQTSFPSEWFGSFSQFKTYVVLHLRDGRRIYGWPEEWPSQFDNGHFSIAEAEWLDNDNRIELTRVSNILIPATEVLFVEFMELD